MIKVVIVEDEQPAVIYLKEMLNSLSYSIEVLAVLDDVPKSVEWFSKNTCDLIFMDIQLGDDSSFSIFERVSVSAPIIFTTAFNEYAIKAFKVNGVDYLLKPYGLADIQFAIEKFINQRASSWQLPSAMIELFRSPSKSYKERFLVMSGPKIRTVKISEIAYFHSESRYSRIVTFSGEKFLLDDSLSSVQESVDPNLFFRVNRQFLVQIDSIQNAVIWSRSRLKIHLNPPSEEEVIVSTENATQFKQWLNR